jgi:hypothetical protein
MDVILQTNDRDKHLAFRNLERYSDSSGVCARVSARAGAFAGEQLVCTSPERFEAFVAALARMDRDLSGSARFQSDYEEHYVQLSLDASGHVEVTGEVVEYGPRTQRLVFGFETDQTCLRPLIRDLQSVLRVAAT